MTLQPPRGPYTVAIQSPSLIATLPGRFAPESVGGEVPLRYGDLGIVGRARVVEVCADGSARVECVLDGPEVGRLAGLHLVGKVSLEPVWSGWTRGD